jgi:anti-sigma regulatory factor (Ser/Thr protein kinase)
MRELSLHVMDIIENSIAAKASHIDILIDENIKSNILKIVITDNGCGMNEELLKKVKDPFVTSRSTRKVGLGLSLFEAACRRCDGKLDITSVVNKGTTVTASMKYDHIDRAPIGRIEDTITAALMHEGIDIVYTHRVDGKEFIFDSRKIREAAGNDLNNPAILKWIREYIIENINAIGGGVY